MFDLIGKHESIQLFQIISELLDSYWNESCVVGSFDSGKI